MNEAVMAMAVAYVSSKGGAVTGVRAAALALADHFDAMKSAGVGPVSSGIAADAIREVVNAE
jgi:hypothetical protein